MHLQIIYVYKKETGESEDSPVPSVGSNPFYH